MESPLQPELESLVTLIRRRYDETTDDAELDKLQYAMQLAGQARRFLADGDTGSAWLRLNGAVGFLRMAGLEVAAAEAIQGRLDQAL